MYILAVRKLYLNESIISNKAVRGAGYPSLRNVLLLPVNGYKLLLLISTDCVRFMLIAPLGILIPLEYLILDVYQTRTLHCDFLGRGYPTGKELIILAG